VRRAGASERRRFLIARRDCGCARGGGSSEPLVIRCSACRAAGAASRAFGRPATGSGDGFARLGSAPWSRERRPVFRLPSAWIVDCEMFAFTFASRALLECFLFIKGGNNLHHLKTFVPCATWAARPGVAFPQLCINHWPALVSLLALVSGSQLFPRFQVPLRGVRFGLLLLWCFPVSACECGVPDSTGVCFFCRRPWCCSPVVMGFPPFWVLERWQSCRLLRLSAGEVEQALGRWSELSSHAGNLPLILVVVTRFVFFYGFLAQ